MKEKTTGTHRAKGGSGIGTTIYAAAFVCMLAAAVILGVAVKGFLKTKGTLWLSVGFSGLAILLAVGSLIRARRS
ncbi:MAG: hypothetical protein ABI828_03655 [Actinomycetota bacterium]